MSITTHVTAEQLLNDDQYRDEYCELIAGEVHLMTRPGWNHGLVVANLHALLGTHIRKMKLGRTFGADTGFLLERDPDTVRGPDFSLVLEKNFKKPESRRGYWPGAPDFLVEVISPNDRPGYVRDKIAMWLRYGCQLAWTVDPVKEIVMVFRSGEEPETYSRGEEIRDDQLLAGFACKVDEFFE